MSDYNEEAYENALIELFQNMGWKHVYGPDIDRDLHLHSGQKAGKSFLRLKYPMELHVPLALTLSVPNARGDRLQ